MAAMEATGSAAGWARVASEKEALAHAASAWVASEIEALVEAASAQVRDTRWNLASSKGCHRWR